MKKIILLTIILSVFSIQSLLSQQHYSRNYTINNGLPDNCIHDIYKDSKGFLWLGTNAGLARFDGKEFITYTSQDGLAGDKIWSITESDNGQIWFGCHDGGLSKFNGSEIVTYNVDSGLISNEIRKIYYSTNHQILLIGAENGLSVLKNNKFISFHKKLHNINQKLQVNSFIETNDYIYVFTNGSGLYKYTPDTENLVRIPSDHPLNNQITQSAYISSNNDTLINFNHRSLFVKNNKSFSKDFVGLITDYAEDGNHNIWLSAWNNNYIEAGGLFKLDSLGLTNYESKIGIDSKNILSLEFDSKENILWIGTKDRGLFLYPIANFSYFKSEYFDLPELNIIDLRTDSLNNLWFTTTSTVVRLNTDGKYEIFPFEVFEKEFNWFASHKMKSKYSYLNDKTGSYEKYQRLIQSGTYHFSNPYKKPKGFYSSKSLYKPLKYDVLVNKSLTEFNSVLSDSEGNIWIGSNVGIFKIDEQTKKIKYFDIEGCQFNRFSFNSEGKLYATNWSDLHIYPYIEKSSEHYIYNYYEDNSPINVSKILSLKEEIWFTSYDHGIFWQKDNLFYASKNQISIKNSSFNDLCYDNKGNIIAGSNNGVIKIFKLENDSIHLRYKIDRNDDLKGNSIRFINCTNDNQLIVGTNRGLNIIDLNQLYNSGKISIQFMNINNGFTDYSGNCSLLQGDHYLWIGSVDNLIKVNLQDIHKNNNMMVDFYLKSILVNNQNLELRNLKDKDPWTNIPRTILKFPHYKNSLTFLYDAIIYLDPENIRFSYKIDGLNENWSNETRDRKIILQNLKPGKYRLRIKILKTNEHTSNQELSINFIILKPLWFKWWFMVSSAIIIFLLVWLIVNLRTKNIKKRERIKTEISERVSEFEMKALRAQMNPHFIFNAINSIQNYMLDNDLDAALNYLSDFAKLIRLTLDNVSKKEILLDDELNYLKYYLSLEQMRFGKIFETEIILSVECENRKIIIPSMILQPYVENSIKHGFVYKNEGGKIKLEFAILDNNILKCIIEDNGIGRDRSREINRNRKSHQSKGTFITTERLSLLNQIKKRKGYKVETIDLYDEQNIACGTRVEIYLPI